jgi:hypothetical protein
MDCQNVQAAIDAVIDKNKDRNRDRDIRREEADGTIGAHVRSCHDCRRYSDETTVLLTMLAAQSRIEAPADFDFKLRARLAQTKDETAVLLTMLEAQPRIEAPADFDFKLRARLARAKLEPAPAEGIFEKLRARSLGLSLGFSWGQAAAATATLAVAVTVTALNFSTSDRAVPTKTDQANHQVVDKVDTLVEPPVTNGPAVTVKPSLPVKSGHKASVVIPMSAAARTNNSNLTTDPEIETEGKDYIWRGFDPENKQFITTQNRDLIGAENSASMMPKTLSFVPSI